MRKVRAHAIKAVIDCIGENQTPAIVIQFETNDGHTLRHTGWLTDAAVEYTIRDLRTCGFVGNDPFVLDGGDCLKLLPAEVMLVTEDVEGVGRNGEARTFQEIKYINSIGGSELAVKNAPKGAALLDIRNRFKAAALRNAAPSKEPDPPGGDEFDDDDFDTD